jgi:hypothetical protein
MLEFKGKNKSPGAGFANNFGPAQRWACWFAVLEMVTEDSSASAIRFQGFKLPDRCQLEDLQL